jgi:UDP-2-acetamido-3-amino-2,3-dideoxy-glucuronate N-acetyltransferase
MDYFVHKSSICESISIGKGTKIWHFSHVMPSAKIGENCTLGQNTFIGENVRIGDGVKIQNNVSIYEKVTIEDDVFIGPSVVFTNDKYPRAYRSNKENWKSTIVKRGASIGANSTIICGVTIGAFSTVGAGSVVTKDVASYDLVYGNPAERGK